MVSRLPYVFARGTCLEKDFDEESAARSRDAEAVAQGESDMIAVGRAMIANPDWTALVRAGEAHRLRAFTRDMLAALK